MEIIPGTVYRAVYTPGQFAGHGLALLGAATGIEPRGCASAEGLAPDAGLSATPPRAWDNPVPLVS